MRYVIHYYKEGRLNTRKALTSVRTRVGLESRRPAFHLRWAALAASVLVIVGFGIYALLRPSTTTLTAEAAQQVYRLADGTVVTLAPKASLSYAGNCRHVRVMGKAFLDIHHDSGDPFTISGDHYTIRDIGTRLQVEATEGTTRLTVVEGAASFGSTRPGGTAVALRAGMSAVLDHDGRRPQVERHTDVNATAWATHEFHFDDMPLTEVLATLSDYYHVRLTAPETDKRLTADYDADRLDDIIDLIEQTLNVHITQEKQTRR
jgi:transmembrane sensor